MTVVVGSETGVTQCSNVYSGLSVDVPRVKLKTTMLTET